VTRRGAVLGGAGVRPRRRDERPLVVCPTPIGNVEAITLRGAVAPCEAV